MIRRAALPFGILLALAPAASAWAEGQVIDVGNSSDGGADSGADDPIQIDGGDGAVDAAGASSDARAGDAAHDGGGPADSTIGDAVPVSTKPGSGCTCSGAGRAPSPLPLLALGAALSLAHGARRRRAGATASPTGPSAQR